MLPNVPCKQLSLAAAREHNLHCRHHLPCMPLRMLRDMRQQPDHRGRQPLPPHPPATMTAMVRSATQIKTRIDFGTEDISIPCYFLPMPRAAVSARLLGSQTQTWYLCGCRQLNVILRISHQGSSFQPLGLMSWYRRRRRLRLGIQVGTDAYVTRTELDTLRLPEMRTGTPHSVALANLIAGCLWAALPSLTSASRVPRDAEVES